MKEESNLRRLSPERMTVVCSQIADQMTYNMESEFEFVWTGQDLIEEPQLFYIGDEELCFI